uniref:Uncharacterized protein n=1 Tax=Quercus lobata TaxID=97700 RepID=A0A7N2LEM0_QUELO
MSSNPIRQDPSRSSSVQAKDPRAPIVPQAPIKTSSSQAPIKTHELQSSTDQDPRAPIKHRSRPTSSDQAPIKTHELRSVSLLSNAATQQPTDGSAIGSKIGRPTQLELQSRAHHIGHGALEIGPIRWSRSQWRCLSGFCAPLRYEGAKPPLVEVYSVSEGSWRVTSGGDSYPPGITISNWHPQAAYLNGVVYFAAYDCGGLPDLWIKVFYSRNVSWFLFMEKTL